VFDYLDTHFDFVVIDTAPVVPITDAYLLSAYCNATLYVVRHKHTPKAIIKRLDQKNKINSLINPAIVFNGVRSRGFFNKKPGYGYGYEYVYEDSKAKTKSYRPDISLFAGNIF
jgi:Mrp family chromosome partitioning ATPase